MGKHGLQEVPPLWDAVRFEVDKDNKKGKFILTGSATPNHRGVMHSGTGRVAKFRMQTMSLYETGDSSGKISLQDLFNDKLIPIHTGEVELRELIHYAVRGGWPGNLETPYSVCGNIAKEYLKTVVDDDMFKVDGVRRDSRKVWALLHSLGRNESTIVSNRTIRKDISVMDDEQVDVVLELPDGTWGAFEIKLGANQIDNAAEELLKLKAIMEKEGDNPPKVLCVICGMSNMAYKRDDGVYVVPITALKP